MPVSVQRFGLVGRWGRWLGGQEQYGHDGPAAATLPATRALMVRPRQKALGAGHRADADGQRHREQADAGSATFTMVVSRLRPGELAGPPTPLA